jgi:hypothetical protein
MTRARIIMLGAIFCLAGCGDRKPTGQPDLGRWDMARPDLAQPDRAQPDLALPDQPPPRPEAITPPGKCNAAKSDCRDLVVSRIIMPTNAPQQVGLELNGKTYNALGAILGALSGVAGNIDLQGSVDRGVNSGMTLLLARLQAADFANDPGTKGQLWTGAQVACCSSPTSPTCAAEAKASCFKGDYSFSPAASSPQNLYAGGSIAAGKLSLFAGTLVLPLPITTAGTLDLMLKGAQIRGTLAAAAPATTTITDGVLAGAIPKSEIDNKIIPGVALMIDATLKDPATPQSTKSQILMLFDADKDGTITTQEVAGNALVKTFLAGDVDVDGDGVYELSVGVGFEAVGAVINVP